KRAGYEGRVRRGQVLTAVAVEVADHDGAEVDARQRWGGRPSRDDLRRPEGAVAVARQQAQAAAGAICYDEGGPRIAWEVARRDARDGRTPGWEAHRATEEGRLGAARKPESDRKAAYKRRHAPRLGLSCSLHPCASQVRGDDYRRPGRLPGPSHRDGRS